MKKIINGKKYDTASATLVGEWSNTWDTRDFNYVNEELYRKKTGEYFLYGEGGANTEYCVKVAQNEWSGGSEIRPIVISEAKKWAEKHMSGDAYEEEFGEVEE